MRGAQQSEIVRLGGAALGIRHDVIDLQQVLRAAAAPAGAVHVAAAAPVAPPDRALDRRRDGAAGPAALGRRSLGPRRRSQLRARWLPAEAPHLRRRSRVARRPRRRSVRAIRGAVRLQRRSGFVSRLRCRLSRYLRRRRSGAVRSGLLLRCRSPLAACGPGAGAERAGAPPARRPGRVVAVEPFLRQPPHDLTQRHNGSI